MSTNRVLSGGSLLFAAVGVADVIGTVSDGVVEVPVSAARCSIGAGDAAWRLRSVRHS